MMVMSGLGVSLCVFFFWGLLVCSVRVSIYDRIAVVYAGRSFHEEVTSVIACMLHAMNFHVVVYLYDSSILTYIVPITRPRLESSKLHYGKCVFRWVLISADMELVANPSISVFISYPMQVSGGAPDPHAYKILENMMKRRVTSEVVLVSHHSQEFLKHSHLVEQYIPRNQTTYMFLARHAYQSALSFSQSELKQGHTSYKLDYIYPVMPLSIILGETKATQSINHWRYTDRSTLISIQGNFGGRHSKRKNPSRVIDCLSSMESSFKLGNYASNSSLCPICKLCGNRMDLDLIGRQTTYTEYKELRYGKVRKLSNLQPRDFYMAISTSLFLIPALNNPDYILSQATSSIPTALISQVPIVADQRLLSIYPCLSNATIHNRINKDTECNSLKAAMDLSREHYAQAKDEVKHCSELFWSEAIEKISRLARQ